MSSVEVIDLENPSSKCNQINDYPIEEASMTVGIIDGLIKSCGGNHNDIEDCYDYNPETNSWITSASLINARFRPRSSFIDGIWLISAETTYSQTTEMWTGTGFELGPSPPLALYNHCQLTVNSTHVFFADTWFPRGVFLLDWHEQTWTRLPRMTVNSLYHYMSCGLINNPENGIEAVIVDHGNTEIFNFREEAWRTGPTVEPFKDAGFTQIGDTFVVVGGYSYNELEESDRIYKFDNINYEWILMSQRLQVPRDVYPGVVAVPDEFVTCS